MSAFTPQEKIIVREFLGGSTPHEVAWWVALVSKEPCTERDVLRVLRKGLAHLQGREKQRTDNAARCKAYRARKKARKAQGVSE